MDVLDIVYKALIADPFIKEQVENRIKFYEYPETGEVNEPYIVIDPIDVPQPKDFADNTWLTYDCFLQIEVWTKNRTTTRILAEKVQQVMWISLSFAQKGGISEYDEGVFRDARRYRGKIYTTDITRSE